MKIFLNLRITVDWTLLKAVSIVDRFDEKWKAIERKEGQSLKELKEIATVRSVGASTRIEGSKLDNIAIKTLLENMTLDKLEDRDSQEVAGYYEVLDLIHEAYEEIPISENGLKDLHQRLLKHSKKDTWHRGAYKKHSNSVQATFEDGSSKIIFKTTPPGYATDDAMRTLIAWYHDEDEIHPLVKAAIFSYEFVSIHPFQDGNGRMSRLLIILLLLKHDYRWIEYISFEHEIEQRKAQYYEELQLCQSQRPNENATTWVLFFLDVVQFIQGRLMDKLSRKGNLGDLTPKQRNIYLCIMSNAGIQSGALSRKLDIPLPTIKKLLAVLLEKKVIQKHGVGRGTSYTV